MPTTLLRGITGASSLTSESLYCSSVRWTPTYRGSPARATTIASSAGMPSSSTSPVTTPYMGSSPVVNLAIRTRRAYLRGGEHPLTTLEAVDDDLTRTREVLDARSWSARRDAHEERVDRWVQPHLRRRR